jgi:hypothetical protein
MSEHQRLQLIREIGLRLQELQLIRRQGEGSYTGLALTYLFGMYQQPKPVGLPLHQTLQQLADLVVHANDWPHRRLTADSVLDYFCYKFEVAGHYRTHPSYRLAQLKPSLRLQSV